MLVNQELVSETDSSSTPARFVLEERLGRMLALEMEDHLWSVRPSLVDGLWWVSCLGKDACTGDGGSPLVCQAQSGRWTVVG